MSLARAESAPGCPENGMPVETLGPDKEQREVSTNRPGLA